MTRRPPRSPLFPSTPLFRSQVVQPRQIGRRFFQPALRALLAVPVQADPGRLLEQRAPLFRLDRKSTRLNSSHSQISYAVFCLKKKKSIPSYTSTELLPRSTI